MGMIRTILIAALLLVSSPAQAQFVGWSFYRWLDEQTTLSLSQAVATVTEADQREWLGYLASAELDGRKPNTPGYRKAVEFIEARCRSWGLQTMRQTVPRYDDNLFAWIEGHNPNEIVVIGAHLDHLGGGIVGADDNASGSSALLAVAYALSQMDQPARTVVFQWYTAEESGLIGSKHYVQNPTFPRHAPNIRSHVAMINMDMIGRLRGYMTYEASMEEEIEELTPQFARHISELQARYSFSDAITYTTGTRSDHASFRPYMAVVWLFTGTHSDYHTRRDTVAAVNFDGLTRIARFATELTWRVAQEGHAAQTEEYTLDETRMRRIGGEPFPDVPARQTPAQRTPIQRRSPVQRGVR